MERTVRGTDSLVLLKNSQGTGARGTLVHLTRNQVVFEVYNPYSIVQLSEVLNDLQVLRGERVVYAGRAVVSNLVSTGLMLIVSATLVDPWRDLAELQPGSSLQQEIQTFVADWEASQQLRPPYQLCVANISSFLSELSRWTSPLDASSSPEPAHSKELVSGLLSGLRGKINDLFGQFEVEAAKVPPEELLPHKVFVRREIHPFVLCAPFVHRTFTKPLGYAGDYEMVNMILREPEEGGSAYARVVNAFVLGREPAAAHRNRIKFLVESLREETRRMAKRAEPLRVLNVGCGPARETQEFIQSDAASERVVLHLLDFNQETLEYARNQLANVCRKTGRIPEMSFIHKSIHDLLKEASGRSKPEDAGRYDFVVCAGLFDYLSDRVCSKLMALFYEWTRPGGRVVTTNVHPSNPIMQFMEHILEWHLIYRNEAQMAALIPPEWNGVVSVDSTGVNVFLDIRKSDTPANADKRA